MTHPSVFCAGEEGQWRIVDIKQVCGLSLPPADFLKITDIDAREEGKGWLLRGTAGQARYTTRSEADQLALRQDPLGRASARCAALIPIRKSEAWWSLVQDERRSIIEETSQHFRIGMDYLPAVARKLYHSRDLGEPFDFLTWFEFAEESADEFETLLTRLRATEEWRYVEREVDVRLRRADQL